MTERTITTRLSAAEKETVLHISLADGRWIMDSTIPRDFNKAVKQGWDIDTVFKYADGSVAGMVLSAPKRSVTIGKKEKPKRPAAGNDALSSTTEAV